MARAKIAKAADHLVGQSFKFQQGDTEFTGKVLSKVSYGHYLCRLKDGNHIVTIPQMSRLGFIFVK